jgi:hypothetical protein
VHEAVDGHLRDTHERGDLGHRQERPNERGLFGLPVVVVPAAIAVLLPLSPLPTARAGRRLPLRRHGDPRVRASVVTDVTGGNSRDEVITHRVVTQLAPGAHC